MARKIMVQRNGESSPALLSEILVEGEAQLQEIMKQNPDLLPVDEFGMTGPLMIVGKPAKPEWATAYYLAPDGVVRNRHQIAEILAELVRKVGESEQ
jgi:hypothetical protein